MSAIDFLLLGAILLVVLWWIIAPGRARRWLRLAPVALLAIAVLQLLLEGITWQAFPAWLLIAVLGALSLRRPPEAPVGGLKRLAGQLGLAALLLVALAPWTFILPAPQLAPPGGAYALGTRIFRWTDAARPEAITPDPADRRSVIVQAWYPVRASTGLSAPYIDGLRALPPQVALLPGFMLSTYGRIDTHAVSGAPISQDRPAWPVILFSPGFGGPRAFYTGLCERLAAKGYVVIALDHPYEAAVTELPDGRIVSTIDNFPSNASEAEGDAYMAGLLDLRAADMRFVLDQLARADAIGELAGHLDLDHIAAIGHSLGGATAVVAMESDRRIKAAANVDGTPYGAITAKRLDRPFLLLQSDYKETGHSDKFVEGNQAIIDHDSAPAWHYEITHANHYSFTDAPLFLALPARFALAQLIGGGRGPVETQRAAGDILAAFLQEPLGGVPGNIEAAAASFKDISGGPKR